MNCIICIYVTQIYLLNIFYYWFTKIFAGLAMTTMTRLAHDLLHTTYIHLSLRTCNVLQAVGGTKIIPKTDINI